MRNNDKEKNDSRWSLVISLVEILVMLFVAVKQQILDNKWERVKESLTENELKISRSNCAVSLIPTLISGNECEKRTAMVILKNLGDIAFSGELYSAVASDNCIPNTIRIEAVKGLGRTGKGYDALQTVRRIQEEPISNAEKVDAIIAEQEIIRRTISTADVFYKLGRKNQAAQYYNDAANYLSVQQSTNGLQYPVAELNTAKFCFNNNDYDCAADKFKCAFQKIKAK